MAQTERASKEELHEDKFINLVMEAYDFVCKQAKVLIAIAVVIVIALVAVSLYFYQKELSEQAASLKMGEAFKAFSAAETDWLDPEKHDESNQKFEEANAAFETIINSHSSSSYADEALFYHAKTLMYLGQYDQALTDLRQLTENYPDSLFGLYAQLVIGQIHAQKGDLQQAVDALAAERFTRFARLPLQEREQVQMTALLERARYLEQLDRPSDALANYEQITQTFEANLQQEIMKQSHALIVSAQDLLDTIKQDVGAVDNTVQQELNKATSAEGEAEHFTALQSYVRAIHQYRIQKETRGLDSALRDKMMTFEKRSQKFVKSIKDANERAEEGRLTSALYNYEQALGGLIFAPGRSVYEKAYAKVGQLKALVEMPASPPQVSSTEESVSGTQN